MRILLPALTIFFTLTLQAQITSGSITYEFYLEEKEPSLSEQLGIDPKSRFIVDFNEHYIRTSFTSVTATIYGNVEDKATGKNISYSTDPETKTIRFSDMDIAMANEEKNRKFEYDYEDEEPDLKNYHDDFYKDLMKLKLNDTVIETTGETKEILGFLCTKTIMIIREKETIIIWSTQDIKGIENAYKLVPNVKGTIMSYTTSNEDLTLHFDAVEFSKTNTIDEKSLYTIPSDYTLELGILYLKSYVDEYNVEGLLGMPEFIIFPSSRQAIQKITNEMDKLFHFGMHKSPYAYVELSVFFDEKGIVTSVELDQEESEEMNDEIYSKKELTTAIKKNCALKHPVTINGKATPVKLIIGYSFDGDVEYNED